MQSKPQNARLSPVPPELLSDRYGLYLKRTLHLHKKASLKTAAFPIQADNDHGPPIRLALIEKRCSIKHVKCPRSSQQNGHRCPNGWCGLGDYPLSASLIMLKSATVRSSIALLIAVDMPSIRSCRDSPPNPCIIISEAIITRFPTRKSDIERDFLARFGKVLVTNTVS